MYLIVGLGNPGKEYANTRHNLGFRAIYNLAKTNNITKTIYKDHSLVATGKIAGERVALAQPQTFMNKSGVAVEQLVRDYKVPLDKLIIIYDDLDLPTGKIRIKLKGSSGGHNGIKSIIDHLGTEQFARIKIGIGRPPEGVGVVNYVLEYFTEEEEKVIKDSLKDIIGVIETILSKGFQDAMTKYN